jgi:hypothetical protein
MLSFKDRSTTHLAVMGSAPLGDLPLDESREFRQGEEVLLYSDLEVSPGRPDSVRAVILEVTADRLRVRALHSFYPHVGERLIQVGDEFDITRGQVFVVSVP